MVIREMYLLQRMSGERALRILEDLLTELSDIDPNELTTFELNILHRCAENPPAQTSGVEARRGNDDAC